MYLCVLSTVVVHCQIALLVGEGDVEGALEVVDELADATSEPLFPSDVNTAIDDIDDVLSLLEDDNVVLDDVVNVRNCQIYWMHV